ncbi:MAG: SHOCT domain-containing protein [Candidatus Marinimicrobia bacterium]|nr:SHOCT domain-containing protein [Candidatus Brocadiales bacterium]MBL7046222.1 SHOCT domain-containing protein [Candidatus Neomarinimicrobiota bacterium]
MGHSVRRRRDFFLCMMLTSVVVMMQLYSCATQKYIPPPNAHDHYGHLLVSLLGSNKPNTYIALNILSSTGNPVELPGRKLKLQGSVWDLYQLDQGEYTVSISSYVPILLISSQYKHLATKEIKVTAKKGEICGLNVQFSDDIYPAMTIDEYTFTGKSVTYALEAKRRSLSTNWYDLVKNDGKTASNELLKELTTLRNMLDDGLITKKEYEEKSSKIKKELSDG